MNFDINKLVSNVKTWLALGAILLSVSAVVVTYANVPKKVDAIVDKQIEQDRKIQENRDSVQQVASTVDKYVMEQRVIRQEQEKREQLMLKLIDEVSKK